ncbi:ABC transporter permease [Duganella sp. FT27W]|uniref:ABC transporter permease n=1 Tax=Duganella sp. FT27W TaxID=2654636 RepID=UPI00128B3997|nr:ABC transporter permease [Duganella sp. FT27W]MPQ58882.1 ABC transporter permease subunit [Duganella sp. FT27W]
MNKLLVVMQKEVRESLRDRRTLMMLLLFVFVYPAMLGMLLNNRIEEGGAARGHFVQVAVASSPDAPALVAFLRRSGADAAVVNDSNAAQTAHSGNPERVGIVLEQTGMPARILQAALYYDSTGVPASAYVKLVGLVQQFNVEAYRRLLPPGQAEADAGTLATVAEHDVSSSAQRAGRQIGGFIGLFFIPAFFLCMSTVIDNSAGERERKTMEVLLAQPVRALFLIIGKWLAAALVGMVGLTLELALVHIVMSTLPLAQIGLSWSVTLPQIAGLIVATLSLPLFAAAAELALALNARSYKEAQTTVGMLSLLPMVVSVAFGMAQNSSAWAQLLPLISNQYLMSQLASGAVVPPGQYALTWLVNLAWALPCVLYAVARVQSPKYLATV